MFQRPTAVTIVCILAFFIGALGLCCTPLNIIGTLIPPPAQSTPGPFGVTPPTYGTAAKTFVVLEGILKMLLQFWLLGAALLAWNMKRNGRLAMTSYATTFLVLVIPRAILMAILVFPAQMQGQPAQLTAQLPPGFFTIMPIFAGGCVAVLGSIFPVVILAVFTRSSIKAAYEAEGVVPLLTAPYPYPVPPNYGPYAYQQPPQQWPVQAPYQAPPPQQGGYPPPPPQYPYYQPQGYAPPPQPPGPPPPSGLGPAQPPPDDQQR